MNEYTYTSPSGNYSTGSPARPFTPTSIYPGALSNLSAGDLSSDSVGSSRSRRGSGSHSPGPAVPPGSLAAIPRSHRYNPLGAAAITRASARQQQQKKRSKGLGDLSGIALKKIVDALCDPEAAYPMRFEVYKGAKNGPSLPRPLQS